MIRLQSGRYFKKNLAIALLACGGVLAGGCDKATEDTAEVAPLPVQGELLASAPSPKEPEPAAEVVADVEDASSEAPVETESDIEDATSTESPPAEESAVSEEPTGSSAAAAAVVASSQTTSATGEESDPDDDGVHKFVSFDTLSGYEYFLSPLNESSLNSEAPKKDQIPAHIRALNEQPVLIEGYMVPIDVEGERIKSFILTNSVMMCCFGVMPWINEWIFVEMANEDGAEFYDNVLLKVKGTLQVGEEIEDGMVVSLYRMQATEVISTGEPMPFLFDY